MIITENIEAAELSIGRVYHSGINACCVKIPGGYFKLVLKQHHVIQWPDLIGSDTFGTNANSVFKAGQAQFNDSGNEDICCLLLDRNRRFQ